MTEKQELFCKYYALTLNQRKAVRMAGYRDERCGWKLMQKPKIREKIFKIKQEMKECSLIDAWDVLQMYIRIGFADIEEFVDFGTDNVGKNYINFKKDIDGQIIDEVGITSGAAKVKLTDRMKALEKLEKYFDLMGYESLKKKIEEQRINIGNPVTNISVITGIERNEEEEN